MSSNTKNSVLGALSEYNNKMVSVKDKRIFIILIVNIFSSLITSACLSVFTTNEIAIDTVGMYMSMIYLNVFSMVLPYLGIFESQPWFVWYIMSFSWFVIGALYITIYRQLSGNLKVNEIQKVMPQFYKSFFSSVILISLVGIMSYFTGWSLMYTVEVYIVLGLNVFAFPVVFFTPFFEFSAPSWILISLYWTYRLDLLK